MRSANVKTGTRRGAVEVDLDRDVPVARPAPNGNGHVEAPIASTDPSRVAALVADHTHDGVLDHAQAQALAAADTHHWWFRSKAQFVAGLARAARVKPGRYVDL